MDGQLDVSDPVNFLGRLFLGEPSTISCDDASDSNADASLDLSDAVYSLAYLFLAGPPPPAPGPDMCGAATEPSLGCAIYPHCPGVTITFGPTVDPMLLSPGAAATVSVTAIGNEGDTLSYTWFQISPDFPQGTFADDTAATTTWTAPDISTDMNFVLAVTVLAASGSAQGSVLAKVRMANHPPVIDAGPGARPESVKPGETVFLGVGSGDFDNDPLTFTWSQIDPLDPEGSFESTPSSPDAVWTAPEVDVETVFTLQVEVSDGITQPAAGTVQVTVTPP